MMLPFSCMKTTLPVVLVLLMFQLTPSAQLAFEVASVKENKTIAGGGTMSFMPDGGITAQHIPARSLISTAFRLQSFQLTGVPAWAANTYYDVIAKTAEPATREQSLDMLQALLVDRFKLTFRREAREVDGFALVQARNGVLGPQLRQSEVDCVKAFATVPRCRQGSVTHSPAGSSMKAVGAQMSRLLQLVIGQVGAPVSDETKLTGTFDFDIQWSNEVAPTNDLTTIYTALQEQLGLKLEKRRVSTEIFVVDRFERATPD
jgi:uncharacterized protein (TIGR03435 family)